MVNKVGIHEAETAIETVDIYGRTHRTCIFPGVVPTIMGEARAEKGIEVSVIPAGKPSLVLPLCFAVCETLLVLAAAAAWGMLPMIIFGAYMVFSGAATGAGMIYDSLADAGAQLARQRRAASSKEVRCPSTRGSSEEEVSNLAFRSKLEVQCAEEVNSDGPACRRACGSVSSSPDGNRRGSGSRRDRHEGVEAKDERSMRGGGGSR